MTKLHKIIEERGIKRTWLAEKTCMQPQNVYAYEYGKINMTDKAASIFAIALGVSIEEIKDDEREQVSD